MGRPTEFCEEAARTICDRLAGGESLRSICRDESLPPESTVRQWVLDDRNGFSAQYARAREVQADALFDEIQDIADTHEVGEKRTVKADGSTEIVQADMIEHRRLRIDARKWMAGKLRPKKYNDKTIIGGDADNPIVTKDVSDSDLARLIVFQLTKASREG